MSFMKLAFSHILLLKLKVLKHFILLLQDFSRGIRLEELNVLLKQTVMVCALVLNMLSAMLILYMFDGLFL
jgi:hypothetical protein